MIEARAVVTGAAERPLADGTARSSAASMATAPLPQVDRRSRLSTIELLRRAETKAERIAAAVAEIACPDCTPKEYLQLLNRALELMWGKGACDHTKFVPTAAGMLAAGEVAP